MLSRVAGRISSKQSAKSLSRRFTTSTATVSAESVPVPFFRSDRWIKTVGTVGAIANWTLPAAAIAHILSDKDPATTINPTMTSVLVVYSMVFMRWSIAISPANYPLLVCHVCNSTIQAVQLARYIKANMDKKKTIAQE